MSGLLSIEVANWKVVATFGVASIVLLMLARRLRRARWPVVAVALLFAMSGGADAVNTYYGYLPQVADVAGVSNWPIIPQRALGRPIAVANSPLGRQTRRIGGVVKLRLEGLHSGLGTRTAYVYLPPQYFTVPAEHFPVVYLLHGSPGRAEDWLRAARAVEAGVAASAAGRPVLLVMPTMSRGWLDDTECVDGRAGRWDSWLVDDVVPAIDATFRTMAVRSSRALAGMSAGGYCSLNLLLRHSGVFGAAVDLSGYTMPTHAGGVRALFGRSWPTDTAANTPGLYLQRHRVTLPLELRFEVGNSDGAPRRQFAELKPLLVAAGIQVTQVQRPGGHTYHVWAPALKSDLLWLAGLFYGRTGTAVGVKAVGGI